MEFLIWASRNPYPAFVFGLFVIIALGYVTNFLVKVVRSITGKYPPPAPPPIICPCHSEKEEDDDE